MKKRISHDIWLILLRKGWVEKIDNENSTFYQKYCKIIDLLDKDYLKVDGLRYEILKVLVAI